jgi:undecaprenyl-diphosphatase
VTAFDRHIERWIVHHRAAWLNPVFETLSRVGTFGLVWVAIALGLALAWRRWGLLLLTVVAVGVSDGATRGLKSLIDVERPSTHYARPEPLVPAPNDTTFPSGHAATSFAAATILTAATPRYAPLWFLLALAIGFSRVYVGVHYPLDVVAGAAFGSAIALLLLAGVRLRSRATTRSD